MNNNTDLQYALQEHLPWNRARIGFIVCFVMALVKVTTVNLTKVANALSGTARKQSNYRRIQRFFCLFSLDFQAWAKMLLCLIPVKTDFVISIDRTNWRFGRFEINILMAAVVYEGTAYPLVWLLLDKAGNSNTKERLLLIEHLLEVLPQSTIKAIVADREFIGKQWLSTLDDYALPYYIRIRHSARVSYKGRTKSAKILFRDLRSGQTRFLRKRRLVYGQSVFVSALRLEQDYLIVVSNTKGGQEPLAIYCLRWGIEVLFASLKTRGFNFEQTHLSEGERIKKLVALLALAFTWAHLVGEWVAQTRPLRLKKHGRRERGFFRLGLDHLQYVLLNIEQQQSLTDCLWLLLKPLLDPVNKPQIASL